MSGAAVLRRGLAAVAALTCVVALAACGDDGGDTATDGRPDGQPDAMAPDAPPAATFTTFVIDLVQNQTAGTTAPRPYVDFATLDDPDTDNPGAYTALFP